MRLPLLALAVVALTAQDIPRPEYPQPQFQRADWLNLNGAWEFEFDNNDQGLDENWASANPKFSRTITVPFAPETPRSGINDLAFHPVVWYRRAITIPPAWKGRRVLLHFGAVDYRAMVWINGKLAGAHEGGHVPFRFDITPLLNGSGTNTITVRAEDPPTDRHIPRGKQYWEPQSRGIFYTRTTGIWQTVWLEATGSSYLERIQVTPTLDGVVQFDARIARPRPGLEFTATIRTGDRVLARVTAPANAFQSRAAATVIDPRLWSPPTPNLYDVIFELTQDAQTIDRVTSYFGFRSIAVEGGRLTLNGRPIFLKMVLDQGYWPESTITPPSDEAIQFDIKATKEMGFNGARKHQKLEDPRFLYWADKLGFLVSSEMANAYLYDPAYAAAFTREWTESVERDYNHPSIVMWIPINESWGVHNLRDPRQQQHLKALYSLTKSLDATRLVIDNDGWEHTDSTDLFGIHDYARHGDVLYNKYKLLGTPGAAVPDNARKALIPGFPYNGSPVFLSEFGGIAYIPPGANVPKDAWGYAGVEKTPEAALERMRSLWQAIAKIPAFIGLCYTQITDVEQEVNGLLTYDRKAKFDARAIREINGLIP